MHKHLTKDGRYFSIRQPNQADAESIIQYSKILFASTDQLLTTVEEYIMTVDEEKKWINESLQNPSKLVLIAELNNQIIGLLFFTAQMKKKNSHTGEFGVSVHPTYQYIGVGRALIETLLIWSNNNNQIEKVFLNVLATNVNAIKLYKNMGFIEEGRHIKAIKQKSGEYVYNIQMYIETK